MKYIVALTGGIGSGKSTVANIFSKLGITVIDADNIVHQMVKPGSLILKSIIGRFENMFIKCDGTLNRRSMREHIFSSSADKAWIEALFYPSLYQKMQHQIDIAASPYILWVVPLLVENRFHEKVNRVLVVDVKHEVQVQRTIKRDNVSRSHVEQIILHQATRAKRLTVADDVIDNNGKLNVVISNVIDLHVKYLKFAAQVIL